MTAVAPAVRELGPDDVDAMVALASLCEIAETGDTDPELVDWIRGGTANDHLRAFGVDDDAGLAAFAYVECVEGHQGLAADVRVRPGLDLALGVPLLEQVRAAAAAFDPAKPVHLFTNSDALRHRRWLESLGAREIRHFWRMAIDLDETAPTVPPVPSGVVVRRARDDDDDLQAIFTTVDSAFAEHFGHTGERRFERWMQIWRSRAGFDLSLWWVAEIESRPVAALLGMTFPVTGHVGTLGTLKEARGRGIGTVLLRTAFAEFHTRGLRRVTLGVDSENGTGAVRLYESVGMRAVNDWPLYQFAPLGEATGRPDR